MKCVGFWINYAVDRTIPDSSQTQWIVPLGLQLLPGAILFFGVFFICPESPRWLARKDRWEDALKILVDIRKLPSDHEYIQTELADIRMTVEERSANRMTKSAMFKRLFEKGTRNRIAIGLLLMCCQNMTGVNIITYCECSLPETGIIATDRLPQTLPASSKPSASPAQTPSSSPPASTASQRPSA